MVPRLGVRSWVLILLIYPAVKHWPRVAFRRWSFLELSAFLVCGLDMLLWLEKASEKSAPQRKKPEPTLYINLRIWSWRMLIMCLLREMDLWTGWAVSFKVAPAFHPTCQRHRGPHVYSATFRRISVPMQRRYSAHCITGTIMVTPTDEVCASQAWCLVRGEHPKPVGLLNHKWNGQVFSISHFCPLLQKWFKKK